MILNGFIYIFSLGLLWSVPETWIGVLYSKIVNKFKKKTNFKTILPKLTQLMHDLRFSSLNYKEELNFPKYKYRAKLIKFIIDTIVIIPLGKLSI